MLIAAIPAQAQNRGVYPLGMSAVNSGITPGPGLSYSNQLLFYSRDEAKDDNGNTLPVSGTNAVIMDMNTLTWVSKETFLWGARYSASATFPFANRSGFRVDGQPTPDNHYTVQGDIYQGTRNNLATDDSDVSGGNLLGLWTHKLSGGGDVKLQMYYDRTDRNIPQIFGEKRDTFDLDYSLMGTVVQTSAVRLQIGLAGYEARQVTAKTGPGITSAASDERYAVNALGVAVNVAFPKQRANVTLKFFDEFADRATFQGYSFQIAGAITF